MFGYERNTGEYITPQLGEYVPFARLNLLYLLITSLHRRTLYQSVSPSALQRVQNVRSLTVGKYRVHINVVDDEKAYRVTRIGVRISERFYIAIVREEKGRETESDRRASS
jgi:hypothetical protein